MASSLSRGLKHSRQNASPTVQVVQIDKPPNSRQSRKIQNHFTPMVLGMEIFLDEDLLQLHIVPERQEVKKQYCHCNEICVHLSDHLQ